MRVLLTFLLSGFCISTLVMGQPKQEKLRISHLTGDFYIFTTYNLFGDTPFPANGMYLVTNKGVVMIDTPWDTTQFQPLLDSIAFRHNKKVVLSIATHYHNDRTGGIEFLRTRGVKTYTSSQTLDLCKTHKEKQAEYSFVKDTVFTVGQYSFQTYYGGEGHTRDNIVVWFPKDKILYGGCLVKSIEASTLGYTGDANLEAWPETIRNIQKKVGMPHYVIPGHQSWENTQSLQHTLKLLQQHKSVK